MQPGDVKATYADTESLEKEINFKPNTTINSGIKKFIVVGSCYEYGECCNQILHDDLPLRPISS